jgi:predicted nucleic acid-binding protein
MVSNTALVLARTSCGQAYANLIEPTGRAARVRLSPVVLSELYAGTRSARDKADLDTVVRAYRSLGFLLQVTAEDWFRAGQAIRRYTRLYGRIEPREHLNDVLILASSGRVGAQVVTENAVAFRRWAALLRRMGCAVRVIGVRRADYLH